MLTDHRYILGLAVLVAAGCRPIVFAADVPIGITASPMTAEAPPEPKRVEVEGDQIVIHDKVQFEFDKARLLPESHDLLDEVAEVISANPQIEKIVVEGHACVIGTHDYNLGLSRRRAETVRRYLVGRGIPEEMLTSRGYGETRPVADSSTEEGRSLNRRVEFLIAEQEVEHKTLEIDPMTGEQRVVDTKAVPVRVEPPPEPPPSQQ